MSSKTYDTAVIGAGIVGLATARELASRPGHSVVVLEAESQPGQHQTGNNSGVIHSGLYYVPGSLKAVNCTEGRDAMYRFCEEHDVPHDRCGKLVVALTPEETPRLDELERRGRANGLEGLRRVGPEQIREREPHVAGIDGLWVPQTGIVDYKGVTRALATQVGERGGAVETGARVRRVASRPDGFTIGWDGGEVQARHIVNCAGLQSDRVARLCGMRPDLKIVPFRGEYYKLVPEREYLVRNLIYPVPDPRFPFLGVHFTRMILGGIEAGPNAVLALAREGYDWSRISPGDLLETFGYGGFWRLAGRYWATGLGEVYRSLSKRAFVRALQRLLPELREEDVSRHGAGVRAQAIAPTGKLVDDFHILEAPRMLHVLNAPSPAATASLSIARHLADRAAAVFGLPELPAVVSNV